MRPIELDIDPADANATGLAADNSSAGATLTLDGTLTSGGTFTSADGLAHRLSIIDKGAHVQTGATYTITGTDADGKALVEAIAGPGASATITTVSYFKTVTSVAIASPVAASTVDMGTVDEVTTKTIPLDWRSHEEATYAVDVTGTIDYTVRESFEAIQSLAAPSQTGSWYALTALSAKTADLASVGTLHATAVQLVINSYTSTAEIQMQIVQS